MTKTSIVHSSEEQGSSTSEKERDVPIAMVKEDGGDEEVNVRVQGRGNCNLDKQKQSGKFLAPKSCVCNQGERKRCILEIFCMYLWHILIIILHISRYDLFQSFLSERQNRVLDREGSESSTFVAKFEILRMI